MKLCRKFALTDHPPSRKASADKPFTDLPSVALAKEGHRSPITDH
jgi:hypothetical protein